MDRSEVKSNLPPLNKNSQNSNSATPTSTKVKTPRSTKSSRSTRNTKSARSNKSVSPRSASKRGNSVTFQQDSNENEEGILIIEPANGILAIQPVKEELQIEPVLDPVSKSAGKDKEEEDPFALDILRNGTAYMSSDSAELFDKDAIWGLNDKSPESKTETQNVKNDNNSENFSFTPNQNNSRNCHFDLSDSSTNTQNEQKKGFRQLAPSPLGLFNERSVQPTEPRSPLLEWVDRKKENTLELNSLSDSQESDPTRNHDHLSALMTPRTCKSARSVRRPRTARLKTPRQTAKTAVTTPRSARSVRSKRSPRHLSRKKIASTPKDNGILIVEPQNGIMSIEPVETVLQIEPDKPKESPKVVSRSPRKQEIKEMDSDDLNDLIRQNAEMNFSDSTVDAFNIDDEDPNRRDPEAIARNILIQERKMKEEELKKYHEEEEDLREKQLEELREKAISSDPPSFAEEEPILNDTINESNLSSKNHSHELITTPKPKKTGQPLADSFHKNARALFDSDEEPQRKNSKTYGGLDLMMDNVIDGLTNK